MHRKITSLWGEKEVILRQTPWAVTAVGGLSGLIESRKGNFQPVSEHLSAHIEPLRANHSF